MKARSSGSAQAEAQFLKTASSGDKNKQARSCISLEQSLKEVSTSGRSDLNSELAISLGVEVNMQSMIMKCLVLSVEIGSKTTQDTFQQVRLKEAMRVMAHPCILAEFVSKEASMLGRFGLNSKAVTLAMEALSCAWQNTRCSYQGGSGLMLIVELLQKIH